MKTSIQRQRTPQRLLRVRPLVCAMALALSAHGNTALAQTVTFPPIPLTVSGGTPPNLLYIHDDSGSMHFGFMPEKLKDLPDNSNKNKALKSHIHNKIYYNPVVTYSPPPHGSGTGYMSNANFDSAWKDGYSPSSGRINLSTDYRAIYYGDWGDADFPPYADAQPSTVYYYVCPGGAANCDAKDLIGMGLATAAEKQNFANWYSYYRTRNMVAKAGIAFGFENLDSSIRLGWGKINKDHSQTLDGKDISTLEQGVRTFTSTRKTDFLKWLYKLDADGGTPLRRALDDAGRYYDRSSSNSLGPWADDPAKPGAITDEKGAECRKSFTLLMTDGYWNGAAASVATGNQDGAGQNARAPFKDDSEGTLADVAWYYWKKDLLPNVSDKVPETLVPGTEHLNLNPPKRRDNAKWQHMVTFTVGLGVAPAKVDAEDVFDKLADSINGVSVSGPAWPEITPPTSASTSPEFAIDDLLHAAVNGHGGFFSATDPQEFAYAITEVADAVNAAVKSSGGLDTNVEGNSATTTAYIYGTTYMPRTWNGDLFAQEVNAVDGLADKKVWNAAEKLPAPDSRKIFTRNGSGGVSFLWSQLSPSQQNALKSPSGTFDGEKVLNYIRGSKANEGTDPGQFRSRVRAGSSSSPLGDSPHNAPFYVKSGSSETLYLGANDGMLHAFDAATGVEQFAYIPETLIPKLYKLTSAHDYFVDGHVAVSDNDPGKRLLVGALGRGGKGVYGLDVTDPAAFSGSNVLWELDGSKCPGNAPLEYLGNIVSEISLLDIGNDTMAVFGNGYNSCANRAALYKVNAANGAATRIEASSLTDNGLAAPVVWKKDATNIFAYAGDLKGQLHKFDLSTDTVSRLFDATTNKPITARPTVFKAPVQDRQQGDEPYVLFGTGRYLSVEDKAINIPTQSAYALIDPEDGSSIDSNDLKQRLFTKSNATVDRIVGKDALGNNITEQTPVMVIENAVSGDMKGQKGWYFDLHSNIGERIVEAPLILRTSIGDVALFISIIPPEGGNPCEGSGESWLYYVDARTGGRLSVPFFDINGDGVVDDNDKVEGDNTSSLKLEGMAGNAVIVGANASEDHPGVYTLPSDGSVRVCYQSKNGGDSSCIIGDEKGGGGAAGRISWREITL